MDTAHLQKDVANFNINSTLSACLQHLNVKLQFLTLNFIDYY